MKVKMTLKISQPLPLFKEPSVTSAKHVSFKFFVLKTSKHKFPFNSFREHPETSGVSFYSFYCVEIPENPESQKSFQQKYFEKSRT